MDNITPGEGGLGQDFFALITTIFLLLGAIVYYGYWARKEFKKWFDRVIELAPRYGFSLFEIECFEETEFFVYYNDDCTPAGALKKQLKVKYKDSETTTKTARRVS